MKPAENGAHRHLTRNMRRRSFKAPGPPNVIGSPLPRRAGNKLKQSAINVAFDQTARKSRMSFISRRPASFMATTALCLAALSGPCLAGGHGGGGSGDAARMGEPTSTGAAPDHSSNGAAANTTTTGMSTPNAVKTAAAARPAAAKKITIQKLIQADRAVHMRNMN